MFFLKAHVLRDVLKIQISGGKKTKSDVLKISIDVFCSHQLSPYWQSGRKEKAGYKPWFFPPGAVP